MTIRRQQMFETSPGGGGRLGRWEWDASLSLVRGYGNNYPSHILRTASDFPHHHN